jgi:phage FluMu protein Com
MIALKCTHCGRHLGEVEAIVGEIICSNSSCKAGNQFKILNSDETALITYKFAQPPKPPKGSDKEKTT